MLLFKIGFLNFIVICCFASHSLGQNVVRLTNGEWPPYLSENLEHNGFASQIVTEAFKNVGISVEYGFFVWKRSYDQAKAGRWDGSVVWRHTPERAEHFFFSAPVIEGRDYFFHLKDYSFDWKTMEDLKGIAIGGTASYHYSTPFKIAEESGIIQVDRTSTDEQNFRKLLKGKIDIFPIGLDVGLFLLRNKFPKETRDLIAYHPTPLNSDTLHLMMSKRIKKSEELISFFNKGLQELKDSGRYNQIIEKSRKD